MAKPINEEVPIREVDITLFEPSKDDFKLEYPELAAIPEFADLTDREMKFTWYVGNRTSPIRNKKGKDRVKIAVEMAYAKASQNKKDIKELAKGKIPDKLSIAIKRMSTFNPSVRLRAKLNVEYIFDQLQDIITISEQDKAMLDPDELKKYSDMIVKTAHEMPKMVEIMEGSFGLKIKRKEVKGKPVIKAKLGKID